MSNRVFAPISDFCDFIDRRISINATCSSLQLPPIPGPKHPWPSLSCRQPQALASLPQWLLLHVLLCSFFKWLAPSPQGLWASPGPPPQTAARPGQPPWHLLGLLLLLPSSNTLRSGSPPQPRLGTAHLCPGMWNSDNQPHTLLSSSPNLLRHLGIL